VKRVLENPGKLGEELVKKDSGAQYLYSLDMST
jgi:hypothetical protein